MTRGEALLAMESGARVRQVWSDGKDQEVFYISGGLLRAESKDRVNVGDYFVLCSDYELVPEPDTAEKFVRDSIPLLQQMGELKSLESAALVLGIVVRGKALIQQMDGEK